MAAGGVMQRQLPDSLAIRPACRPRAGQHAWQPHPAPATPRLLAGQWPRCHGAPRQLPTPCGGCHRGRKLAARVACEGSNGQASAGDVYSAGSESGSGDSSNRLSSLFNKVLDLPWEKAVAWGIVAVLAVQMKSFFGIIMGTFVLSFIGNGFVQNAQQWPLLKRWENEHSRRRALVMVFFLFIISVVTLFGVMTIPDMVREGADFVERLQNDNIWVVVLKKMRSGLGEGVMDQIERFLLLASSDDIVHMAADTQMNTPEHTILAGMALQKVMRRYTEAAVSFTSLLLSASTRFAVQVGVSLVLSFMLVWDMPVIARGVSSLSTSRVAPIYNEVAPSLVVFGQLFGKALGAQTRIALVNTFLTAAGMWALQIPGVAILSLFVFICGFIPIAGCFISTVPIGFVALTEYGFMKLALVIMMVTVVHFIEAYGLNPAIYSAHLKLHPLLVLTVLVVAEHSLGIWGLLLAVPLTVFMLDYCLRYPACSVTDVAARELRAVNSFKDGPPKHEPAAAQLPQGAPAPNEA